MNCFSLLVFSISLFFALSKAKASDDRILLALKEEISMEAPPRGWERGSLTVVRVCTWSGVTCDVGDHVEALNLSHTGLRGSISQRIHQLKYLISLDLSNNFLYGNIPSQLSNASRTIQHLDLSNNKLSGHIPQWLGSFYQLQFLSLASNNLTGKLPASLSNCSQLYTLNLHGNFLKGTIPQEFSHLSNLQNLSLLYNNLTGGIPSSLLRNCSKLQYLALSYNNLTGTIPVEIGSLPQLEQLWLDCNNLSGSIPVEIGNLSNLVILCVFRNRLGGKLPRALGHLSKLIYGVFHVNFFTGEFPVEVTNISTLQELRLFRNHLDGHIPKQIGNMASLNGLLLHENFFSGPVPSEISNCSMLDMVELQHNNLDGWFPREVGRLKNLGTLHADFNQFTGPIPETLAACTRLQDLSLSYNRFIGEIPAAVAGMVTIVKNFALAGNMLSGSIPPDIRNMKLVQDIDLSGNNLSGVIPPSIGGCEGLVSLNLSYNFLTGPISTQFQQLKSLETLDLSNNRLTGAIPPFLGHLKSLRLVNVSNNMLEGPVPNLGNLSSDSFHAYGNKGLCGWPLQTSCSKGGASAHAKLKYSIAAVVALLCCVIFMTTMLRRKRRTRSRAEVVARKSSQVPEVVKLSFTEVHSATEGFHPSNIIGRGGSSTVYIGTMPNNNMRVAIKVLREQDSGIFIAELAALAKCRHRNLVKVLGYCFDSDFKALVLQLVSGGTLEQLLLKRKDTRLKWQLLLDVAIGVAQALVYLHHEYGEPALLHGDLKPSNILLDEDMTPHLADFGLVRTLVNQTQTTSNFKGTFGYAAPETATSGRISTKCDVYSYGIVLLEMVTRQSPTDQRFEHGMTLPKWVAKSIWSAASNVPGDVNAIQRMKILQLAIMCCSNEPKERPDMRRVVSAIKDIRELVN